MNPRYPLLLLVVCLLVGGVQAWGEDMGAWDYRKEFTINNTGSELTNYQVMFTVNRSAGSDSGTTVYLDGNCAEDYDDLRFTTSDGETLLDYWIESSSSTVANVWVEFDSIPTGDTLFYIYYGNSGASAVSNGDTTFLLFDDFNDNSLDTSKWDVYGGSPVESGGSLTIAGTKDEGVISDTTFETNTILTIRGSITKDYNGYFGYVITSPAFRVIRFISKYSNAQYYSNTNNGTAETQELGTGYTGTHTWDMIRNGSTSVIFKIDGSVVKTHSTYIPTESLKVMFFIGESSATVVVDYVFVHKYSATEPTVSAWGSEESNVRSVTADFSGLPTSGNLPVTVYFLDNSSGTQCIVDEWQWSFGDSTANSTQQNPAHTYTTSGLYDVILTAFNTTYSKEGTLLRSDYINVTYDPNAPTADFTTTETCGNVGDTFYFIDFSTGGGLYAWNWSFGDGSYSEMRNPTHQYAGEGTYDVSLHVWGAYGDDSLLRSNLITVPCGAATPTPTPTVTLTSTPLTPGTTTTVEGGRLTPLAFVVLAFLVCGLTVYTFADNQNRNYLYIATAAVAMIVSFLLGIFLQVGTVSVDFVNTLDEVTVNETVMSTYDVQRVAITDTGFGYFFTFWGVVMLIITILAVIELFREPQRRYEE